MNPDQIDNLVREQGPFVFDRMLSAMEKVRQRLERACGALNSANVPNAVVGGNAVAAWVATKDEGAVRNTRDVVILLDSDNAEVATDALDSVGFIRVTSMDVIGVGLIDKSWLPKLEPSLADRLQELLDDPDG